MYHYFAIHGLCVGCRFFVVMTSLFQVTCFCIFHAVDFIEEEVSVNGSVSFSSSDCGS